MKTLIASAKAFLSDETGASMVEYALVVSLIALAVTAAVGGVATALNTKFNAISTAI
jgi:pilus assembly protein Flp/PilA